MKNTTTTITALATPSGRGGVGIIRISGNKVPHIAQEILGKLPKPRYAEYLSFLDENNETIDQGIAIFFPAPHSFTGEDVLELHGHGGPIILDLIIQRILTLGAELAKPGEFSERAFLNDKLDLTQAEAIADLIDAQSTQAARSAVRSLQGEFSKKIKQLVEQLIQLRMYVEAAIDFPEEEIDFLADQTIHLKLQTILSQLDNIQKSAKQGSLLRDGMTVVIAGKPNAGKSTLLNVLSGQDIAIVTEIPGTTRDILHETIQIDGMALHIIDTAGLRQSDDIIEQEGIKRAHQEMAKADRVLLVADIREKDSADFKQLFSELKNTHKLTIIFNKIDLINEIPRINLIEDFTEIMISAKTGEGIDLLREHLKRCMGYEINTESNFLARRRHLEALANAYQHVNNGYQQLQNNRAGELLAEELRCAQEFLNEITGEFLADDLLGKIFSSFCIGK